MAGLTTPQKEMLLASAADGGAGAASFYPPAKKLVALGLIEERQIKWGSRFFITDAGRLALSQSLLNDKKEG